MKIYELRFKFYLSLFLRVQLKYSDMGSDNGMTPARRRAISWTNDGPVCWRIHASLALNMLNQMSLFRYAYPPGERIGRGTKYHVYGLGMIYTNPEFIYETTHSIEKQ